MSVAPSAVAAPPSRFQQFYALTKPRVVQLIVFCALIGMVLAVPGLPNAAQLGHMALACLGVWLVAGAAAAFNCIVEQGIDAKMKRTAWRPTAKGELSNAQTLLFHQQEVQQQVEAARLSAHAELVTALGGGLEAGSDVGL